jgi:ATP-binding cassette subfamily C protein
MTSPAMASSRLDTRSALKTYAVDLCATLGRRRLVGAVLLTLSCTVLDGMGLLLLVPLLQLVDGTRSTPALQWLHQLGIQPRLEAVLVLFVSCVLTRVLLARWRELVLISLRLDYVDALRRALESSLARSSWSRLATLRHADVTHVLFDQLARVGQGTFFLLQAVSNAGLALASVVVALVVSPSWSMVVLLPLLAVMWILRRRLAAMTELGSRFSQGQRAMHTSARALMEGLKLVKVHAAERQHLAELQARAQRIHHDHLEFASHQSVTRGWFEGGSAIALAGLLYAAATWGQVPLPQLILIVLVFSRLLPLVREAQFQMQQIFHMLPAYQDVQAWIATGAVHEEPVPVGTPLPLRLSESLRLEGISFRYPGADEDALSNVCLTVQAKTTVVLSGDSGSGKTTLVDVLSGLLPVAAGEVRVDGQALGDGEMLRRWRRSVAYVGQDSHLFPGSIRDNLCWLSGPQPDAVVWNALDIADAAGFVEGLAGGLDHPLGERGQGLSGGERQRIALARAMVDRPDLLILDEVTSQLDAQSEDRILHALHALHGQLTIILIAHRPAALRLADRIITIDGGRLIRDVSQECAGR